MTYNNNDGSCFGGWGCGGFGWEALILLLFFGGMSGGMWGGWGGMGGGAGMLGTTSLAATETATLISQQNTADRVAAIAADTRQILGQTGGIIEAVNTVGNRTQDGFARVDTNLCQLGNNIAMQAVNNHNNLTSQLTEMRFANQQCCCDTKQLIQSSFCDLRHQMQTDKCDTLAAVAAAKSEILGAMQAQRMAELEAKNLELKGQISQNNQTAAIIGAIRANDNSGCCYPSTCCSPYQTQVVNGLAAINSGIQGIATTQQAQGATLAEILTKVSA